MSDPEFNALPPELEARMKAKRAETRERRARESSRGPAEFGGYRLDEEIGEGPGGKVWAATDPQGAAVALKLVRRSVVKGVEVPGTRARLARERVAPLVDTAHPQRVGVLEVVEEGDRVGVVMPRVEAGTLDQRLREAGRLPHRVALEWVADAAEGVADLHARGLVHGDVKSRNLFVDPERGAMVSEPGTAEDAHGGAQDRALALAGTPTTFAPERFEGAPASAATDVYALGVVAFQALTRTTPARGPLVRDLRAAHREGVRRLTDLAPDLPVAVVEAVESALAPDPADRPDAATYAQRLRAAAAVPADQARRERASGLARWWWDLPAWGRRGIVAGGVLLLFALLVLRSR